MGDIEMTEPSDEFTRCWNAAGLHLQAQVQGPMSWLKARLLPPFLEHLSFRLGNQLFFVRVEPIGIDEAVPGTPNGLLAVADGCKGHACIMPMVSKHGNWQPYLPGWGLMDLRTKQLINPIDFVSDENIPMTDWEIQDFAVQVVRDVIEKDGYKLMSWNSSPHVNPSIWFVGDDGPEWIIVRAARTPASKVDLPSHLSSIIESCSKLGKTGSLVTMVLSNKEVIDTTKTHGPLWRGHVITVSNLESKLLTTS
jgi:hypothetical protein